MDAAGFASQFCADQLKALSEPIRLRIVKALLHGEMTVGDIASVLETEVVTVSHHLGILKNARIVESRRDGRYILYRMRADLVQLSDATKPVLNFGCCRLEVDDEPQQ